MCSRPWHRWLKNQGKLRHTLNKWSDSGWLLCQGGSRRVAGTSVPTCCQHLLYLAKHFPWKHRGTPVLNTHHMAYFKKKRQTLGLNSHKQPTLSVFPLKTQETTLCEKSPNSKCLRSLRCKKKIPSTLCTHKYIHHIWIFEFFIWKWPYLIFAISFKQAFCAVEIFYTQNALFVTKLNPHQNSVNRSNALCKIIHCGKIPIYCVKSPIQCKITCCGQNCTLMFDYTMKIIHCLAYFTQRL